MDSFAQYVAHLPIALDVGARATIATVVALAFVTYLHRRVRRARAEDVRAESSGAVGALAHAAAARLRVGHAAVHLGAQPVGARCHARCCGSEPVPMEESVHSPEELRMLVEQSEEGGAIEEGTLRCSTRCSSSRRRTRAR